MLAGTALAAWAMPAQAQQVVRAGQTINGSLSASDATISSGEYIDRYTLSGRAGETLTIRVESGAIDPYLLMRGPNGFSEDNDDVSEADRSSELVVTLPASGSYTLGVTSYSAGETGTYRLSVRSGSFATARATGGTAIVAGRPVNGQLASGDTTLPSGEYIDYYTLQGQAGESYEIGMRSSAIDSYLLVRGPGDLSEDNDDDERGATRDSHVRVTLPESGEMRIGATSYASGESGAYTLTVSRAGRSTPPPPQVVDRDDEPVRDGGRGTAGTALVAGRDISGRLAQGDEQLSSGEFTREYSFQGRAGQRIDLTLRSTDFDPYLMLRGPGGFSEDNDDDPAGGTNSRVTATLPSDGRYTVTVTSYQPGETGSFNLRLGSDGEERARADNRPDTDATPTPRSRPGNGPVLAIGETRSGRLAQGDGQLNSGEFTDVYRFTGQRGQRVAIDVGSTDFDTYVMLRSPSGEGSDNDDGPDGTNARITQVLGETGEYQVTVTSYQPGETGNYTLSVMPGDEPESLRAVRGGQRVFAVMVGISDYQGEGNDLPLTDEDATKLEQTLRSQGLLNPASVTLTNAEGTLAGVRRAFASVAAQAGPDDVFLFFYSGHGGQERGQTSATEPDGMDETLTLYDGDLTDDELGRLFGTVRARLSLAVLDSCFSGGFERDVVSRPGVMGIFSSEEDLTSSVADKFEAGGYIAHFIRDAFTGEGDTNGDRVLAAGELSAYLRERFNAPDVGRIEASTIDDQQNYQNLVIVRGSVKVEDAIVRLRPDRDIAAVGR
jgi:hypothetical protein